MSVGRVVSKALVYKCCYGVHPIDVTGHIFLDGGVKPSCSPWQFQGQFLRDLWCWTVLRQVSTEENHLAKNSSGDNMNYH